MSQGGFELTSEELAVPPEQVAAINGLAIAVIALGLAEKMDVTTQKRTDSRGPKTVVEVATRVHQTGIEEDDGTRFFAKITKREITGQPPRYSLEWAYSMSGGPIISQYKASSRTGHIRGFSDYFGETEPDDCPIDKVYAALKHHFPEHNFQYRPSQQSDRYIR